MLVDPGPSARPLESYPYRFHIALDGNGINGLEGMAGVCIFLYDPSDGAYAYKVRFYDGSLRSRANLSIVRTSIGLGYRW